jgi:large subunit ribosomal protein L24
MLREKLNIKKNDKVKILSGKDRGKIGKVLSVNAKKNKVLVENINMMKHHRRPNVQLRQGGIIEKEVAIHRSKVMLMCSKCVKPARIKIKQLEDGGKFRMCARCNETID